MRFGPAFVAFFAVITLPLSAFSKSPFTFDVMMKLARIGDPQLSPDGTLVAFTVQTVDIAGNTKPTQIYTVPVSGGTPRQITHEGTQNARPRWMPDSKRIVFTSNRTNSGQLWMMNAEGGEPRQLTNLPTEAQGETVSFDGKLLLFTSLVYPVCAPADPKPGFSYDADCNKKRLDEEAASKIHARIYKHLLYRHWTDYQGARRSHLLIQPIDGGTPKDLTPGDRDIPPFSLDSPESYRFSPDGREIAYVANTDPDLSTSTNSDLFSISVTGGEPKRLTNNPAGDQGPLYSPDGKYLAFRTQIRAGYESDTWRLAVLERASGRITVLTRELDRPVSSYSWAAGSRSVFFTVQEHGHQPLMMAQADGSGALRTVAQGPSTIDDVQVTKDGKTLIYSEQSGSKPVELRRITAGGGPSVALTGINEPILSS